MFLKIHGGAYTLNINLISEIEWSESVASITMVTGQDYDVDEPEELEALKKAVGY